MTYIRSLSIKKRIWVYFGHIFPILTTVFIIASCRGQKTDPNNLDFEQSDSSNMPAGWKLNHQGGYYYFLDQEIRKHGKQSLRISIDSSVTNFGSCTKEFEIGANISEIVYKGFLKTEIERNGFAGLWMRVEDLDGNIVFFKNMSENPVYGKTDWNEYTIEFQNKNRQELKCYVGALFVGSGKIWVDNLQFSFQADSQFAPNYKIDANIINASKALDRRLTEANITNLKNLCLIWGFSKYYHSPRDNKDWDSLLFRIIPQILGVSKVDSGNKILESFLDQNMPFHSCNDCSMLETKPDKLGPHLEDLLNNSDFSSEMKQKISRLIANHSTDAGNQYFQINPNIGNADFRNEKNYRTEAFPKSAFRFLALCRYWNIIEYLFPYRYTIYDWPKLITKYVPKFIYSSNKSEYLMVNLELIGEIHDSHANIIDSRLLDSLKGNLILPFNASFINNKLIITGLRQKHNEQSKYFQIGDEVISIDNTPVDTLVKKYLKYTPSSNTSTQLFYLSSEVGFLLRSNKPVMSIGIVHNKKLKNVSLPLISLSSDSLVHENMYTINKPPYSILNGNIGYINPSNLRSDDFPALKKALERTTGIIVDLRCYPSSFMPFIYGNWFKTDSTMFARFTNLVSYIPGKFQFSNSLSNGNNSKSDSTEIYKGKLIILVNSTTISRGELTAMALRTTPHSMVIGSQTAGADGDVTNFTLPGNIQTRISGIGVYYPDFSETQGTGIKIDLKVEEDVESIKTKKDLLLEKAMSIINQHK